MNKDNIQALALNNHFQCIAEELYEEVMENITHKPQSKREEIYPYYLHTYTYRPFIFHSTDTMLYLKYQPTTHHIPNVSRETYALHCT